MLYPVLKLLHPAPRVRITPHFPSGHVRIPLRRLLPLLLGLTLTSQLQAPCGVAGVQTLAFLGVLLECFRTPCGAFPLPSSLTEAFWLWADALSSSSPLEKSAPLAGSPLSGVPERWLRPSCIPVSTRPMGTVCALATPGRDCALLRGPHAFPPVLFPPVPSATCMCSLARP